MISPGNQQELYPVGRLAWLGILHSKCMCMTYLVLATVPNRRVGSGSGSDPELNRCNGSYHTKTRTVAIGPVLPPKTRHYKSTIFAPIKYLSSDRIVTWSVGKLCSFSPSFTSGSQICGRTNIRRVAIENPGISPEMWCYFTVIQWILVQSQIWHREVKERLKLHNLRTDHIVIRSEIKYLIGAKVAGKVIWNRGFMSGPGNKPAKTERVGLLGGSWPGPGPSGRFQPGSKSGNPEPLLTLDLLLHSIWGLLVEQQQWSLPFELLVQTLLSSQNPPTCQRSLLTKTSSQPISSRWWIERAYSQLGNLPIHCIELMLSAAWDSCVDIICTMLQWCSIR